MSTNGEKAKEIHGRLGFLKTEKELAWKIAGKAKYDAEQASANHAAVLEEFKKHLVMTGATLIGKVVYEAGANPDQYKRHEVIIRTSVLKEIA